MAVQTCGAEVVGCLKMVELIVATDVLVDHGLVLQDVIQDFDVDLVDHDVDSAARVVADKPVDVLLYLLFIYDAVVELLSETDDPDDVHLVDVVV